MLKFFQKQNSSSFTHDKPIAVLSIAISADASNSNQTVKMQMKEMTLHYPKDIVPKDVLANDFIRAIKLSDYSSDEINSLQAKVTALEEELKRSHKEASDYIHMKPMIYGATSLVERTKILEAFKTSKAVNTIFLSKVGDKSIDILEANVILQISSHVGDNSNENSTMFRLTLVDTLIYFRKLSQILDDESTCRAGSVVAADEKPQDLVGDFQLRHELSVFVGGEEHVRQNILSGRCLPFRQI
nr:DNA repair helicase XPB1 [Ipomoea batatas]